MKSQLFAPEIDNIIENINWETAPVNPDIYLTLKNIYVVFSCVQRKFLLNCGMQMKLFAWLPVKILSV